MFEKLSAKTDLDKTDDSTFSDLENDSGSQFGDDDSEYEENENDNARKKILKRGRGGPRKV